MVILIIIISNNNINASLLTVTSGTSVNVPICKATANTIGGDFMNFDSNFVNDY